MVYTFKLFIGQAVPLFLLCTFILSFNSLSIREGDKSYWFSRNKIRVLFGKILKPFLMVQLVLLILLLLSGNSDKVISLIKGGGLGSGSYYPWIYLQFWLVMPFLYGLFEKIGVFKGGIFVLVVNQLLQYGCSVAEVSEEVYRLLCFRYIFLSVFAYMILKYSIKPIWYVSTQLLFCLPFPDSLSSCHKSKKSIYGK